MDEKHGKVVNLYNSALKKNQRKFTWYLKFKHPDWLKIVKGL